MKKNIIIFIFMFICIFLYSKKYEIMFFNEKIIQVNAVGYETTQSPNWFGEKFHFYRFYNENWNTVASFNIKDVIYIKEK